MKKCILLLFILSCPALATHLGNLTVTDYINVPIDTPDSSGFPLSSIDSVDVLVFKGNLSDGTTTYSMRTGANPVSSVSIDSVNYQGCWQRLFKTQVTTIDGNAGVGLYTFIISSFKYGKPFNQTHSFYLVDSSFNLSLVNAASLADSTHEANYIKNWMSNMMSDSGLARVGADQVWPLRGLHIKGTTTGDTAFIAIGNGVGHGAFISGDLTNTTSIGLYVRGLLWGIYGLSNAPHGTTSAGIAGVGGMNGIYGEGFDYGIHAYSHSYNGHGVFIESDSGDALQLNAAGFSATLGCDTCQNKHAIEAQGGQGPGGDVVRFLAHGSHGDVFDLSADSGDIFLGRIAYLEDGHWFFNMDSTNKFVNSTISKNLGVSDSTTAGYLKAAYDYSRILALYNGAVCDTTVTVLWPKDGTKPKDSAVVWCVHGAVHTRIGAIQYFINSGTKSVSNINVVDSIKIIK
jgi:hypothetical protein